MPYGSLSKAYRTEIALGHLHANLVNLFKIRQRRLQKTKSMSGNINNRGKYKKKPIYKNKKQNRDVTNGMQMKQTYRLKLLYFFICKKKTSITELIYQRKRVSPGERQMHVYDSQNSEMLKLLSFTRTTCRGGGGFFLTLSHQLTYQIERKKPKRRNNRKRIH